MDLDQLLEVESSGLITVGAHTLNHPILKNESDEVSYYEITDSIFELQKVLKHQIRYFAYPNGIPDYDFSEREISFLIRNNISLAVSGDGKFISKQDNKLALPRLILSNESIPFVKIKIVFGAIGGKLKSLFFANESKNRHKILLILEKIRNNKLKK